MITSPVHLSSLLKQQIYPTLFSSLQIFRRIVFTSNDQIASSGHLCGHPVGEIVDPRNGRLLEGSRRRIVPLAVVVADSLGPSEAVENRAGRLVEESCGSIALNLDEYRRVIITNINSLVFLKNAKEFRYELGEQSPHRHCALAALSCEVTCNAA